MILLKIRQAQQSYLSLTNYKIFVFNFFEKCSFMHTFSKLLWHDMHFKLYDVKKIIKEE